MSFLNHASDFLFCQEWRHCAKREKRNVRSAFMKDLKCVVLKKTTILKPATLSWIYEPTLSPELPKSGAILKVCTSHIHYLVISHSAALLSCVITLLGTSLLLE